MFTQIQLYKLHQQCLGFNFGVLQFLSTFPIFILFDYMYKDNIHKIWSPEIYLVWMVSQTFVKWISIIEFITNIYTQFYRIV